MYDFLSRKKFEQTVVRRLTAAVFLITVYKKHDLKGPGLTKKMVLRLDLGYSDF